ncbi:MAG: hypothetical protein A3E87_00835 [Gammaproteobacteria bacterium RIFCSPHIGHO2_12_FULL_35_23]|nr:MAG: hypothetical protein A3E87_00835 [Gammaproteobacteria bacterium RIFCSPHIGHO2_12_FULL_35_23]
MNYQLIITCEHASNKIPAQFRFLFINQSQLLQSHCSWDIGAFTTYKKLVKKFPCQSLHGKWSRLLIDLNRSLHHSNLYSQFSRNLTIVKKNLLVNNYYLAYHNTIKSWLTKACHKKIFTIHLSIHSFTPQLNKQVRLNDIGFLYDPKRAIEKQFCANWKAAMKNIAPTLNIRMNYPYRGNSDGLTSALRKSFNQDQYIGIELEINQKHFNSNGLSKSLLLEFIATSLQATLLKFPNNRIKNVNLIKKR